ncbi:MAG: glycosyltransferase N-terminal domain-containing protein [Pseudomonadota bacterium]
MSGALGLSTYRAFARRGDARIEPPNQPRPAGELVWLHAAEPVKLLALQNLAQRLCTARLGLHVLITAPALKALTDQEKNQTQPNIILVQAPSDHPAAVALFLAHWRPQVGIWTWGDLQPNLILEAAARKTALMLIDAEAKGFARRLDRWLPALTRHLLGTFNTISTRSETDRLRLISLGATPENTRAISPLLSGGQVLASDDQDLSELSTALHGRPAWFAVNATAKELPIMLTAHHHALRLSHRLMLIINLQDPKAADHANALCTQRHFSFAHWDQRHLPDDTTQVLFTANAQDHGLFFRLAPVAFMGSTLDDGRNGCDPLNAAALGCAVLYGPKVGQYMHSYSRMAAAGAARIVNDADTLGTAVSRLIAPDQAATMAHAGWEIISEGAGLIDHIVETVQETLDRSIAS